MSKSHKVVWYEGMKLDPHHFQQLEKYFNYSLNSRLSLVNFNFWGFSEIQIDNAALANGALNLLIGKGVMQDGLFFNIPDNDIPPRSRQFENFFKATDDKLEVYLAIPLENMAGNNCQLEDEDVNKTNRYRLHKIDLFDDNVGSNQRKIGIARPNFYIKFGNEIFEDFSYLKIGEIERASDGTFLMNESFIPPQINLSGSESIMKYLSEILGALVSKAKVLRNQLNPHKKEISIADVEILMLLQTINTYIPLLNQYYNTPNVHPEIVYSILLCLGGQLCTIMTDSGISTIDFKPYEHKNINENYKLIYNQLIILLNIKKKVSKPDTEIPLKKHSDSLFVAELSEEQLESKLFIVVNSEKSEKVIVSEFANKIKIASHEEIFAVHQAGLQGIIIEYVSRPPSGLSIDPENHYFRISKEGRIWNKIVEKRTLAFFLASEFSEVKLTLISYKS